ncbi:MAG TPA: hypothetical protein PL033_18375 [Candidatus Brocadiia bacterium]|nr:hypothetical protein [Candidatus Brocadiia bacterium]
MGISEKTPDSIPHSPAARESGNNPFRAVSVLCAPAILCLILYGRTVAYDLAGDDYACLARAIDSGPWHTLFIGPDTLKNLLQTEDWRGDIEQDGSDVFRPGNVWFFKLGWALFGNCGQGYRLLKLLLLIWLAYAAIPVANRLLCPADTSLNASILGAVCSCLLIVNYNVQFVMTLPACEFQSIAAAAFACMGAIAHDKWARTGRIRNVAFAVFWLTAGLSCRENGAAMLVLAACLDIASRRSPGKTWKAWIAYVLVIIGYLLIRMAYYGGSLGNYSHIPAEAGLAPLLLKAASTFASSLLIIPASASGLVREAPAGISPAFTALFIAVIALAAVGGRTRARTLLLPVSVYLAVGPGYIGGIDPPQLLLPALLSAVFITGSLRAFFSRKIAVPPLIRSLGIIAAASMLALHAGFSILHYARWAHVERLDAKAEQKRNEVKRKVVEISASASEPTLIVFLLVPVDQRYGLFENTMAPAVRIWTGGRCVGHGLFVSYPMRSDAAPECKISRKGANKVVLKLRRFFFCPSQATNFGPVFGNDDFTVTMTRSEDPDGFHTAELSFSDSALRRFAKIYFIVHDGASLSYCRELREIQAETP